MVRRGKITEEQVFDAANLLSSQGKEVTPTALLAQIGSGSYTTIYKHLATWASTRATAIASQPPTEIPETVKSAFGAAWRLATTEAGKEVMAIREKATEEVKAAEKKLQDALETIERLESEIETDATQIETLTADLENSEKELKKTENENAALKATTEELNKRIRSQESELERMHKELEGERKRNQEERSAAAAAASAAQEKAMTQLENLQKELAINKSELERTRHDAELKIREATQLASKADENSIKLENELAAVRKEKDAAVKESAILTGQVEAMKVQNSELMTRLNKPVKPESKS